MADPSTGQKNPHLVNAFYQALIHAVTPSSTLQSRRTHEGQRWTVTHRQTVTTVQGSLYLYIENLTNDSTGLHVEPASVYVGGVFDVDYYKNADVNTGTFTADSFTNLKTGDTSTPDADAFQGTDNNVTINDKGTAIILSRQGAEKKTAANTDLAAVAHLGSGDNILIELNNQSGSDNVAAITLWVHESPPDQVDLDA